MRDFSRDFSLYIHIPFCRSKCAYCDFLSFADDSCADAYFEALCREIRAKGEKTRAVDHIYVGGGTPSIAYRYFPMIKQALSESFILKEGAEISMECNPESVTADFVAAARDFGVNRISIGVQTLSDPLLMRIGRAHDRAQALAALDLLTKSFPDVGADVMVGLPEQTAADVCDTLARLLAFPLKHISCYSLILEEGTRLYDEAQKGLFAPDEDVDVDLYDRAVEKLYEAGFRRYEISNFCKYGALCGYNTSVWQYGDYLGLGLGAASFLKGKDGAFGVRERNLTDLSEYILHGGVGYSEMEEITLEEGMREFVMLGLRLEEGLNLSRFRELFGMDFYARFGAEIKEKEEYLLISEDRIAIRPDRFYVSNAIIGAIID